MGCGGIAFGEKASAFEGDIHIQLGPGELGGIALGGDADRAGAGVHLIAVNGDVIVQAPMHGIELQQMGVVFGRAEIIDADDGNIIAPRFQNGPVNQASNTSKSVDCELQGHRCSPMSALPNLSCRTIVT